MSGTWVFEATLTPCRLSMIARMAAAWFFESPALDRETDQEIDTQSLVQVSMILLPRP
jgi:hypothetical protein